MTINSISIDFVCHVCQKQIIAATLNDIWYAAGRPCCSWDCQQAELVKLSNQALVDDDLMTLDILEKEATS